MNKLIRSATTAVALSFTAANGMASENLPVAPEVTTDVSLDGFISGQFDKVTCTSGDHNVQIVPLLGDNSFLYIALPNDGKPEPLADRQAAVNKCLDIGLGL